MTAFRFDLSSGCSFHLQYTVHKSSFLPDFKKFDIQYLKTLYSLVIMQKLLSNYCIRGHDTLKYRKESTKPDFPLEAGDSPTELNAHALSFDLKQTSRRKL